MSGAIFKQYFKDSVFEGDEVTVRCPFPHYDENGNEYFEERPSAHINTEKGTFHCKVCDEGYSETKFLAKINGISYKQARQLISEIESKGGGNWDAYEERLWSNEDKLEVCHNLGFTDEVIKDLRLGYAGKGISFPVFMYGELMDIRTYNYEKLPNVPKWSSEKGSKSGLIIPFDLWIDDERPTLIMAGEKDMALARSLGYNAINFTGGEQAFPKLFKASFRDRNCYIVYDNDEAGKQGARKVAAHLKEAGAIPFIIEAHHEVVSEKGGDFHDYIMKHGKTKDDFDQIIANTQEFSDTEFQMEKEKTIPTIKLIEATQGKYRNKFVRSSIQVTAVFDTNFGISDFVEIEKIKNDDNSIMQKGDKREWSLDDENLEDMLLLMDSRLKDKDIEQNLKRLCGIPQNEKGVVIRKLSHETIFKATVTDLVESDIIRDIAEGESQAPQEFVVYTIGKRLQSGMKYKLTYKMIPHPLQQQENIILATAIESSDDTVSSFKLTERVKESLKVFQGNPRVKMQEIFERGKGLIGSFANENIFFASDLVFHTPLEFVLGPHQIRGTLDVMIVGESRTGKSATATKLIDAYELGTFSTLKNATVAGLIGGSNKVNGSFKTMVGTIPRNHKGLLVFEEFSGADANFIKAMTDIRSSGTVRLTRVSGPLMLPATVRMLTLSNQKTQSDNITKPLRNYPNGVSVLVELIGASEDVARYDFFVLVPEPDEYADPLATVSEPFSKESYKNRVRWVWSRKKNQIKFDEGVDRFIIDQANAINREFKSHIKFFSTEAWKKIARVSVAVAGMLVSTDDTWENIVVKKEHVEWAVQFLIAQYDNDVFRFRQYCQEQNRYSEVDEDVIARVQMLYNRHSILLTQLETTSSMSSRNLQAISGLEPKAFSEVMNDMARLMLFQWQGDKIVPSERFRKAMSRVDRNARVRKIGESF